MSGRTAARGCCLFLCIWIAFFGAQAIGYDDDNEIDLIIEWINHYDDKSDFNYCDDNARGFRDGLQWSNHEVSGNTVWETDFKIESKGNGDENSWVDAYDFAYFCGQANVQNDAQTAYFENESKDGPNLRPHEECEEAYGDVEMEWIAFMVSKFMEDRGSWLAKCFGGAHLMLGWKTNRQDTNMGTPFGEYLVDSDGGGEDVAMKIVPAWEQAADDSHSNGLTTLIIGENEEMGEDYVHGQADGAQQDPYVNDPYFRWEYTTGSRTGAGSSMPERALDSVRTVRAPARSSRGYTVTYEPEIPVGLPTTLQQYPVLPVTVNEIYVRGIATAIRSALGADRVDVASSPVGQDAMGNFVMSEPDGDDFLLVSPPTGAATLIDTGRWLAPPATVPDLPDESTAQFQAVDLLTALGRIPGVYATQVRWFTGTETDKQTGTDLAGELRYNIEVVFSRLLNGYPVTGPGAKILVTIGDAGYVERWSEGGWRNVGPGQSTSLLSWDDVVTGLTDYGSACTIDGVTVMADSIHVNSVEIGYYEHDRWTDQQYLRPTYIINATLNLGTPQANNYTIHVDAVGLPMVASIENPADGSWFSQGSPVSLAASADNGTEPYSFEWSSNIDGVLGIGATLEWSSLSVAQKGWTVGEHTITVTATDSAGARSSASIGLGICPGTWYTDADGDGYGDPSASGTNCPPTVPVITTVGDDCDDTDTATHPGAAPNDDALSCMKDSDLDDWGDPSPPPGVTPGTDCDDTNGGAALPGADEVNDGLDNQCPGEPGHGVNDETSGNSGFHNPTDNTEYSWPPQTGATSYEVKRSELPDMSFACTTWETADSFINDSGEPTLGGVFHYLNRPTEPNLGSWGQDSTGAERATVCP